MMPPHITRVEPAQGEPLAGDVITVHGYSLRYQVRSEPFGT